MQNTPYQSNTPVWRLQDAKAQFSALVDTPVGFIEHLLKLPKNISVPVDSLLLDMQPREVDFS